MGLATMMYVQDYDEVLPVAIGGLPDVSMLWTTIELIEPYVKNRQIRLCPSDKAGAVNFSMYPGLDRYSYGWNKVAFAYQLPMPGPPPGQVVGLAEIEYPAETTCFFDGHLVAMEVLTAHRHNDGANVAFMDGHAKWHNKTQPPRGCGPDYYHVIPN